MKTYYIAGKLRSEQYLASINELYPGVTIIEKIDNSNLEKFQDCRIIAVDILDFDEQSCSKLFSKSRIKKLYMSLLKNKCKIEFESSPQCNSDYLKELVKVSKNNKNTIEKYLDISIENYMYSREMMMYRRKLHVMSARKNGSHLGITKGQKLVTKKSIQNKELIKKLSKDFDGTLNDEEIMRETGLSRNTYYKYKKEIKNGETLWQAKRNK